MALAIESSTIESSFTQGTDIGVTTQFSITAPSGIEAGNLLFAIVQTERADRDPTLISGFTEYIPTTKTAAVRLMYKHAVTADETATAYTFTEEEDDDTSARWAMYRISGNPSFGNPIQFGDGFNVTADGTSASESVDVDITTGGLLFVVISGTEVGVPPGSFSSLVITGATASMSERWDGPSNPSAGSKEFGALFDGLITGGTNASNVAYTYGSDAGNDDTIRTSIFTMFPPQNASTTPTFTTTAQVAFAPAGSAGTQTTPTFVTTTNVAFAPTGKGTTGTAWVNENKPSTTWTNEEI